MADSAKWGIWVVGAALLAGTGDSFAQSFQSEEARERVAKQIAPVLLNPPITGLLVYDIIPGSQAAANGLAVGDVVTHYDGQAIGSLSDLSQLALAAAREKRGNLLVVARRGGGEVEAQVDPAPLGVRLIPVQKGRSRVLWREATPYNPEWSGLRRRLAEGVRWEWIFESTKESAKPAGFIRSHLQQTSEGLRLDMDSRFKTEAIDESRSIVVEFVADRPTCSIRSIMVASNGRPVLNLRAEGDRLVGDRSGVAVAEALPPDTLSSYLAGIVVTTLPRRKGACLRCSYLEDFSQSAAPFADLYCEGPETVKNWMGREIRTVRYQLAVFGRPTTHFWVDETGELVGTLLPGPLRIEPTTADLVRQHFGPLVDEVNEGSPFPLRAN